MTTNPSKMLEQEQRIHANTQWAKNQTVYYTSTNGWTILAKIVACDYVARKATLECIDKNASKEFPIGYRITVSFDLLDKQALVQDESDVQIVIKKVPVDVIKEVEVIKIKEIRRTHLKTPDDKETWIDKFYNWYWYTWKNRDKDSVIFDSDI